MMKHLKHYESIINDVPQIGDYVITDSTEGNKNIRNFLLNNIGQIKSIHKETRILVKYENVPERLLNTGDDWCIDDSDILYHSNNKKDLEEILAAKKYNL